MNDKPMTQMEELGRSFILQAGNLILERFGTTLSIQSKGKYDYVTNVDKESEALITESINSHFPHHHVMSEEMENPNFQPGVTWVIDPLDGTANFIHGFPMVAVSIAVYADKEAILGFVLDPIRHELFSAVKGRGAYLNGKPMAMSDANQIPESIVATGFPFRSKHLLPHYLAAFERIFHQVTDIRRAGSAALDLAYLASGRIDGFWEIGLKAWDIAAGALMIREAGGYVSDFWGKDDYIHNGHIVAGTESTYGFLLEQVRTELAPALEP